MGDIRVNNIPEAIFGRLSQVATREQLRRLGAATAQGLDIATTLLGSIEWEASVRTLLNDPMAEAFEVDISYLHYGGIDRNTGREVWLPTPRTVHLFDGKAEGGRRRVNFLARDCPDGSDYKIAVRLSPRAKWQRATRFSLVLARKIKPAERRFRKTQWLVETFEVVPKFLAI